MVESEKTSQGQSLRPAAVSETHAALSYTALTMLAAALTRGAHHAETSTTFVVEMTHVLAVTVPVAAVVLVNGRGGGVEKSD